jgi:hypothetical protein
MEAGKLIIFPKYTPRQGQINKPGTFCAWTRPGQPRTFHEKAFLCWVCATVYVVMVFIILMAVWVRR